MASDYRDFFKEPAPRFGGGGGFIFRSEDSLLLTVDMAYGDGFHLHVTTDPLRAFADKDKQL